MSGTLPGEHAACIPTRRAVCDRWRCGTSHISSFSPHNDLEECTATTPFLRHRVTYLEHNKAGPEGGEGRGWGAVSGRSGQAEWPLAATPSGASHL